MRRQDSRYAFRPIALTHLGKTRVLTAKMLVCVQAMGGSSPFHDPQVSNDAPL